MSDSIPPKLQQLLQFMPDVDKVKLLQIAQHYALDLDDPSYLPLLLTTQGIAALRQAQSDLTRECAGTVAVALNAAKLAFDDAATAKANDLENRKEQATAHLNRCAAESELAIKKAVEAWSFNVFSGAVISALQANLDGATEDAKQTAITAANAFEQSATRAATQAKNAADSAQSAITEIRLFVLTTVLFFGFAIGGFSGFWMSEKFKKNDAKQMIESVIYYCKQK